MQRRAARGQQLAAARELERVVGVAPVGGATAPRNHTLGSQLSEVVGDQALGLFDQVAQLANAAIAARELDQQLPAERIRRQREKGGRGLRATRRIYGHAERIHQFRLMQYPLFRPVQVALR